MSEVLAGDLAEPSPLATFAARYGAPVLLAVAVHGLALLLFLRGWSVPAEHVVVPHTEVIRATLLALEQKAPEQEKKASEAQPAPKRTVPPAAEKPIPTAPEAARPESRKETPKAAPPAPPKEVAAPQPKPAEDTRTPVDSGLDRAIDQEASRLAAQAADQATASYVGRIVAAIERNWSRPPSARNGMQAELTIGLVPTGEVVSVDVTRSSGNAAFDRSAEVAVRNAAPFEVPDDSALFEARFRRLHILFNPEDLRK